DHRHTVAEFRSQLDARLSALKAAPAVRRDFVKEMQRFLPAATVRETVEQESYWGYLTELVRSEGTRAMTAG
ncbi:MAG: nucleotidyl transferase AbiEii/AbiGii toxin family protein, partial [Verrucomicrobiota bacterium]